MDEWERGIGVLPPDVQVRLQQVPETVKHTVQEIRFRTGCPVLLTGSGMCRRVDERVFCAPDMARLFTHLCAHSVYSHQEELRHGYIATANGCRAGIAGQAVVDKGRVLSVRGITSICLRLAREHRGCASPLLPYIRRPDRLCGVLICGGPAGGKTTLLRDLIRLLSEDTYAPCQLAVVDERGELTATFSESRPFDVLFGYTKAQGMEQALRTLSPQGIVFDELGDEEDVRAVMHCLHSGVAAIGSVHADGVEGVRRRPALLPLLQNGGVDYLVIMHGRNEPGKIERIMTASEVLN